MPAGIGEIDRVVGYVRIPVPGLRIDWVGDDGIRLQEAAYRAVVEASMIIYETVEAFQCALTSIAKVSLGDTAWISAHLSKGQVRTTQDYSGAVDDCHSRTLRVGQDGLAT
jgi:hypothetical protein